MQTIDTKKSFDNHFVEQQLNAVYLASAVVQADIVKSSKKGIAGYEAMSGRP